MVTSLGLISVRLFPYWSQVKFVMPDQVVEELRTLKMALPTLAYLTSYPVPAIPEVGMLIVKLVVPLLYVTAHPFVVVDDPTNVPDELTTCQVPVVGRSDPLFASVPL